MAQAAEKLDQALCSPQPNARMPPAQGRGLGVAQAIEERLHVLRPRMVQHRPGQRAFTVKLDLRRPIGPDRIEQRFIARVIAQPDEDAATLADAQMHRGREGLEIARLTDEVDGDQRPGGGEAFTGHGGGLILGGLGYNAKKGPKAKALGQTPGIVPVS
jgi:hypothetical protein